MDYKEIFNERYEELEEELGREPTLEEIRDMELSIYSSTISDIDFLRKY